MSKYTRGVAMRKFSRRFVSNFESDHLSGSAFLPRKTTGADGTTIYNSEMDALGGDRRKLESGTITYAQFVARWPKEKSSVSTGLIGGITNVVKDAAKLAVAPVTIATGKKVELSTGIGKVAGDALKMGIAPVTQAVSSVTGKPISLGLQTKAGQAVGAVQETGAKALNSLVKGFADTVTLGYATKAANLIRSDENKEKAFQYNEMKPTEYSTGIKAIDKVTQVLPAVSAAVGGAVAGVVGGSKLGDILGGSKQEGTMKENELLVGGNVLDQQMPMGGAQQPLQASMKLDTKMVVGIILAILALVVVAKLVKK